MNILLTSCGRRAYLVKYFKEALAKTGGGEVHCVNSDPVSPCAAVCDRFSVAPEICDERYIGFLLDYCQKNKINGLVSLFDIDLPVLASARELFEKTGTFLVIPDRAVLDLVSDKYLLGQALGRDGLAVPESFLNPEEFLAACDLPAVVKPRCGTGSIETYIAENGGELAFFFERSEKRAEETYIRHGQKDIPRGQRTLVQRFVKGDEYGLDIVFDLKGGYVGTLARKKIRMRSGETDACVTVKDPLMEETGAKIAQTLSKEGLLRGCIDADVIVSDGKAFVIDVNARFGGGYPFSHNAGADIPLAIVKQLAGDDFDRSLVTQRPGVVAAKAPDIFTVRE